MANPRSIDTKFDDIDTNRDGVIDKSEFQEWASRDEGLPSSSYASSIHEHFSTENSLNRLNLVPYSSPGTTLVSNEYNNNAVIHTRSQDETNDYLAKTVDIYRDPNPQILRRSAIDSPRRYEQRIIVRYLQPPDLQPPGPLIIEERRPPQPPAPPSLVVSERPPSPPPPPPIILRELPPTPPPIIPTETKIVYLPPTPVPPRSVVIKRFSPAPEKPRDIIIERWLPYAPQPPRQTIVRSAPPLLAYPEPQNKIEIYETVRVQIVRKFKKLDPVRENPRDYAVHYGGSLLDSTAIVQEARKAGVYEDLSAPGR